MIKKTIVIIAALFCGVFDYAQPCPHWPADCPADDYANVNREEDSIQKLLNPVVPQEVAMENRLRHFTAGIVSRLSETMHWEAVELGEDGSSGFRTPDDAVLVYEKRPPHWFSISYQLFINNDSLLQWKEWLEKFSERRLEAVKNYASHPGDTKNMEMENNRFDKEKKDGTIRFHDACLVVLQFDFNMDIAQTAGNTVGNAGVAGAGLARWYKAEPDMLDALHSFTHSANNAVLLFGPWNLQADGYGNYRPLFMADKAAADKKTGKKIKCDQVQTVVVHLSGNKKAMQQCINAIDWNVLNVIIVK